MLVTIPSLAGSSAAPAAPAPPATDPVIRALELTRETFLVDTYIDLPYRLLVEGGQDLSTRTASGHFDHPRARQGGLDESANKASMLWWEAYDIFLERNGLSADSEAAKAREAELREAHPVPPVPRVRGADQIDPVAELVGIDHVGIASDFDGVRALPEGLVDASRSSALVEEPLRRGSTRPRGARIRAPHPRLRAVS